jgi:hypothetical protein
MSGIKGSGFQVYLPNVLKRKKSIRYTCTVYCILCSVNYHFFKHFLYLYKIFFRAKIILAVL